MELTFNSPSGVGALGLRAWSHRLTASFVAAPAVALGTFIIAALNQHAPYDIVAGEAARVVAGIVPLIAAGVAGLAVLRPRIGLLAMLLVTPLVDVAQISWTVGSVQVIDQTLFVVALGLGLLLYERERRSGAAALAATTWARWAAPVLAVRPPMLITAPAGLVHSPSVWTPASDRASRCRSWRFARRWP